MSPATLRVAAFTIAVLGVIDPAVTSERRAPPIIAIVADDTARGDLADRVAEALESSYQVVRGPFAGAAASVVVGTRVPAALAESRAPAAAVVPGREGIAIERVTAPSRTTLDSRVPVVARVRVPEESARTLEVLLRNGDLVLDRAVRDISDGETVVDVPLTFVPTATGSAVLRVVARAQGREEMAEADVAIDVRDERHAVLFFDHRPSWQSTFVRRAVAGDARFDVTSRIVTSRGLASDAGRPPTSLADAAGYAGFEVVVVGAPELLRDDEIRGLERFMRERGGSVVLLLDHAARGNYERLAGVTGWREPRGGQVVLRSAGGDSLNAGLTLTPARLPPGAVQGAAAGDAPVIWRTAVGAGSLVVSGALDAWRYRDRPGFTPFWRALLAAEAASVPPAVEVRIPGGPVLPGATAEVQVTVRDAALTNETGPTGVTTSISVRFETTAGRTSVKMWPDGRAGRFRGAISAPREPGLYRLVATAGGTTATTFLAVVPDVKHALPDYRRVLGAWVESRGGRLFDSDQLDRLPDEVARLVTVETRTITWFPMRSAWWIVPFVLLLGTEWWISRSRLPRSRDDVHS